MKNQFSSLSLSDITKGSNVIFQASVDTLIQKVLEKGEGSLTVNGAVSAFTGKYTGRSPKDKFFVEEESTKRIIDWGKTNRPISETHFEGLYHKMLLHLSKQDELFSFQGYVGSKKEHRLPIQVINEYAWHNLFARQLFVRPTKEELETHTPAFTVLYAPTFQADPEVDGTNSETFIIVSFEKRVVLIGGTEYAGELKKSMFTVLNYLLPQNTVLPMHCSANVGEKGDVSLFFGLSGTGKTTLSADANRQLIGDDEHGWSNEGVFNFEGGCYAKCANLSEEKEPEIYNAIRYGSVLENVVLNEKNEPLYYDLSVTENTRTAYPISNIPNSKEETFAGHPNTIFFLTADASGTLPPISKLTKEQAMYHFLSGYTSKLAGTERGITSPQSTFSTCFGEPFFPLSPLTYANMLGDKMEGHDVDIFLINTGWIGGKYGTGERISLSLTRRMIQAAMNGELKETETVQENIFGLHIPKEIEGIPSHVLFPRQNWNDEKEYEKTARELAVQFKENIRRYTLPAALLEKGGPLV